MPQLRSTLWNTQPTNKQEFETYTNEYVCIGLTLIPIFLHRAGYVHINTHIHICMNEFIDIRGALPTPFIYINLLHSTQPQDETTQFYKNLSFLSMHFNRSHIINSLYICSYFHSFWN